MRILFIGGTGNISSECAALLHQHGHEIFVLTRGKSPVPPEYHALAADRHDPVKMRDAISKVEFDAVVNFIGYEPADVKLDADVFSGRTGHYVFISSTTVHAKPPRRLPITEDAPLGNQFWEYARKKEACEACLLEQGRARNFPVTIVRPSHTYSKRWIPNAISSGTYNFGARIEQGKPVFVHDGGQTPWTMTAARDFAVGLAGLLGRAEAVGQIYQITSDEVLTWREIYREISDALGVRDPLIHSVPTEIICGAAPALTGTLKGDKAHPGIFDNSRIKRVVPGFACKVPFRQGIRESVEWLRADPFRRRIDPAVEANIEAVLRAANLS